MACVGIRRVAKFVLRRGSVPILLLLAGVAAVVSAIAVGSVTWKSVWIGVASSCITGGLVDGSALLEARRRDKAVLRIAACELDTSISACSGSSAPSST